ncbi:ComF family protein [Virgibacillus litoralis]|uniref:Competence protein ComFC n=1 Tax=Virgibacillus litoralis TaxID=578221 RepID=A0ABS4HAR6_9BACI|nr:ComF family protein [Virgibacillus litoralis]MBP1947985.1 competence protein ComFC [Virgibacillus litoralis]
MNCLWCDAEIIPEANWENLLILSKPKNLCSDCEKEFSVLEGKRCRKCSRKSEESLCQDCKRWNELCDNDDPLVLNFSVFHYNEQMQDMISRWKYRGDYCLGNSFKRYYTKAFDQEFSYLPKDIIAVPIPLSNERMKERGFNQSLQLARFLPLKTCELLTREHGEKQSKKTRKERISTLNPFKITKTINKPVILTDDIYTTGSTLRHAASLLKEKGCPAIYALTLVRG